jgi:predicted restriction endonuclease
MRQVTGTPNVRYHVLGLAHVVDWQDGYFLLEGLASERGLEALAVEQEQAALATGAFEPQSLADARERVTASIVRRRGQPEFRRALLQAYGRRCAITGCDAEQALEAAHIIPYRGRETNHLSNGLLLRADLHTLFDLGLVAIDTATMTVVVAPSLNDTTYHYLDGKLLSP